MSATAWPPSLHSIGSKALGGAEPWVQRFAGALSERGAPAAVAVRAGGALAQLDLGGLPVHALPFRSVRDLWSRRAVRRAFQQTQPDIVQTYMDRATRLTRLAAG
ncbi:glycosyltransferase [Thiohalocapsa marina]|uniref:Glycosyltransferase n=1 Tax=Thiohalocapsa marina TaxID=424902 RepID=A0A5M8FKX7_9GAMM|nr:glycosyltransferase [Thiohalocapsa marina]KAA6184640.1 glycosyltransferase [Thiohalocapsa marina]